MKLLVTRPMTAAATKAIGAGFDATFRDTNTPLTEAGLLRLLLTPAVAGREVAGAEALEVLRGLHAQPGWSYLTDDASLAAPAIEASVLAGRKQVTDLHLVNLAAAHEATLVTFDARILPLLAPKDRGHVRVWDA